MSLAFRPSSLAPPGLVVDDVISEPNRFVIRRMARRHLAPVRHADAHRRGFIAVIHDG